MKSDICYFNRVLDALRCAAKLEMAMELGIPRWRGNQACDLVSGTMDEANRIVGQNGDIIREDRYASYGVKGGFGKSIAISISFFAGAGYKVDRVVGNFENPIVMRVTNEDRVL